MVTLELLYLKIRPVCPTPGLVVACAPIPWDILAILLCAHGWPRCREQRAPIHVWCCIRTVNVLGQISPHLRPLLSVVVTVLVWGLQQGCVYLGTAVFSRQALGMENAASSHECGKEPKWPLRPPAPTTPGGDGAVMTPVDLNAT